MPKNHSGSVALLKLIAKDIRQLDMEMIALTKHMKLLKDFAANPVAHQSGMMKMSSDAAMRAAKADKKAAALWLSVRKASEKLPGPERKQRRKELESALARTEKNIAKAAKEAETLFKKLKRIQKTKIIDSPADGALQIVLVALQALMTAYKGWNSLKDRSLK